MVIDSSAILSVLLEEPDASAYASAITNDPTRLISAATLVETSIVLIRRRTGEPLMALDVLIARLHVLVIPVDQQQVLLAREGFLRFGKGRHRAKLNFGDCFSYALAKQTGEPLLFKGNDFVWTDVLKA